MLCLFTVAAVAAFIGFLVFLVALIRSDGDLLLMFKTKYGKQPDSLAGKVVWITGASSGIGEYIAYCLAGAGCKLVLSARRKEELETVKQKCLKSSNGKITEDDILVLPLDVVAFETHKPAVQKVLEYFNKIDILVNNAGKGQRALWMDVELSVDRELFEINVLGPVSLTQEVLPHMIQRKQGQIAVVSSVAGKMGAPTFRSYTGSKHAVQGYFESLRTEMGQNNIDITLVCPGPVFSNISMPSATGKSGETVNKAYKDTAKRMATDRCAYLTSVAIANKLYETWISEHPSLVFLYLSQYFPDLARWLAKKFGVRIVEKMREGQ
uniref:Dehydrogenase/reductase SDR family member 7 n=1 Tax=Arion vulgaris TaxID=1028688 RepID=A0A0B6XZD8_9EUPU